MRLRQQGSHDPELLQCESRQSESWNCICFVISCNKIFLGRLVELLQLLPSW